MQTTLLGFAFAIILALLAALIAPFFVDWTQFRPVFEAEASRVVGLPVRVTGTIDARILPSPSLTLHGLEIGEPNDPHALHARTLNVEFALGPLLRGEFRAAEARLVGPEITLGLDQNGVPSLPSFSLGVGADALSIDRLNIEDGSAHLVDAETGSQITLGKLWFNGDLRSLAGPFKGEGAFVANGELYGYRVSTGRYGDDGSLRFRLSVDPSDRLLTAEADGALTVTQGKPRFEGTLVLSRPAGLVAAAGESKVKLPWRIESKVDAGVSDAKLDQINFLYGSQDDGVRVTGTADLRFGRHPLFKGVLSTRQLDLDRLIATPDHPTRLPADAFRSLIAGFSGQFAPPVPTELSLSADSMTLGGASLQMFGADVRMENGGWSLDRVEFRAPGLTQVSLSGRLGVTPSVGFEGPVNIETNDPGALAAWLEGRTNATTQIRPLKLRGDVVLNQQQITIDRLKAEVDRKALDGKLHYVPAHDGVPSRLDADVNAPELDLDALLAFFEAVRSGSGLQPPSEIALGISVGRATIAGIQAQNVQAHLTRNAKQLQIERLSVADLGGAKINATGRVDTSGAAPRGSLALDIEARDLDGIIALVGKFAPQAAAPLRRAAARVPAAKLHVTLGLDGPSTPAAGAMTTARIAAEGQIGGLRASVHGQINEDSTKAAANGVLAAFGDGDVRFDAQIDGDDGQALIALIGLDKVVAVGKQPGFVNVRATGKPDDLLKVEGRIVAGSLDGKVAGTARVAGEQGVSADLQLDIAKADIRPLGGVAHRVDPLPLTLHGWLALSDQAAKLDKMTATLAGTELHGALRLGFGTPLHVSGEIQADTLDAAAAIATAIGVPPSLAAVGGGGAWSAEPYGPGEFGELDGSVDVKIMRASLTPSLLARQVQAALVFHGSEIALDKFDAQVAGGRLAGHLSFRRSKDGLAAHAQFEATALDAAAVLPGGARPVVGGRLSAKLDLAASGLSPRALIGSLAGTGTVRVDDGYFSSLDPKAFDTVIRASDQGLAASATKIHAVVSAALDSGKLRFPRLETTWTINAGQAQVASAAAEAVGAAVTATGSFDLTQQQMDARLTLTGPPQTEGSSDRPDIFIGLKGSLASPRRTVDVSALTGWLTIRRLDQQAKKLEALEAARLDTQPNHNPPKPELHEANPKAAKPAGTTSEVAAPDAPAPTVMERAPAAVAPVRKPRPAAPVASTRSANPGAAAPPLELAPPLPAPTEIRRLPRGPVGQRGSALEEPTGVPLWLPSAQPPSVMDSLIGPQHQR